MTQYKYGTVLVAQNDGKPPNDNLEEGDKIIRAGKHETDSIEYITEDNDIHVIAFETIGVYESDSRMSQREAHEFAREKHLEESGVEA